LFADIAWIAAPFRGWRTNRALNLKGGGRPKRGRFWKYPRVLRIVLPALSTPRSKVLSWAFQDVYTRCWLSVIIKRPQFGGCLPRSMLYFVPTLVCKQFEEVVTPGFSGLSSLVDKAPPLKPVASNRFGSGSSGRLIPPVFLLNLWFQSSGTSLGSQM